MKRSTREWVRKAEADHVVAGRLSRGKPPLHDIVCFHCQQCAEKYSKALLQELGLSVSKTHDSDLFTLLLPHHPTLRSLRRGLHFLTHFAIDISYPGENASKRQAEAALRWSDNVRTAARTLLGIRPPRRRRKKSS
jgi:HEPN domain-containing protein